jgi:hypothetical protein
VAFSGSPLLVRHGLASARASAGLTLILNLTVFDDAPGKVLQINEDEFHRAIKEDEAALAWSEVAAAVVLLAVAVLTYTGLRPRLREYAV